MWIATEKGFFSIVKDTVTGSMLVRARKKRDLKQLFPGKKIITDRNKDYAYRVFATQDEVAEKLFDLGLEIEYHNFKSHIGETKNQKDKLPFYGQIWSIMNDYQSKFIKALYHFSPTDPLDYYTERYGDVEIEEEEIHR